MIKEQLKYYVGNKLLPDTRIGLRYFPQISGMCELVTCTITRKLARWFATVLNNIDLHLRKWISVTLKYGNYTSLLTLILPTRQQWIRMFSLPMVVPGGHSMQARWLCCTIPLRTNTRQVYRDRCSEQTHHIPFHRTHITSEAYPLCSGSKLISRAKSPPLFPVYPHLTDNKIKQIQHKSAQY